VVGNIKGCIGNFSERYEIEGFGFYLGLRVWLMITKVKVTNGEALDVVQLNS
jgi:hypothetical protein